MQACIDQYGLAHQRARRGACWRHRVGYCAALTNARPDQQPNRDQHRSSTVQYETLRHDIVHDEAERD